MRLMRFVMAAVALAFATQVVAVPSAAAATKIRVTIPVNSFFFLPLFVAADHGLFEKHGLDAEIISTNGDGPDVDAVIAGSSQFAVSTPNRLLTAYQGGKPLLAVMTVFNRMGIACFMNKETAQRIGLDAAKTPVEKMKKLRGLTIAGTRAGAFTYLLGIDYLKRAGLTPQKDAKVIGIGGGPAMIAAVENKLADMGCFGSPIVELAVDRGKSVWFINNTQGEDPAYKDFMFQIVYVLPSYAKAHPDTVRAFVATLLDANRWIAKAKPEELLAVVKKRFGAVADNTLAEALRNVLPAYSQNGVTTEKGFQAAQDFLKSTGMLKGSVPFDAVIDNGYLPR